MVTQQYEKAKAIQEEQLERLTQICQEQGVSNTFRSTHLRLGLAEEPVMPGSQSLGTAEVHRPHSASSCASAPAQAPFTAEFNKCVFSVSFGSSVTKPPSRRVWKVVECHHRLILGKIPTGLRIQHL